MVLMYKCNKLLFNSVLYNVLISNLKLIIEIIEFRMILINKNYFEWVDKIWAGLKSVLFNVFALILPVFLGNLSIFILFCHHYLVLRS